MPMKRRAATVLVWLVTIWETLTMGLSGAAKFMGDTWQLMFATWGYPVWFTSVVGVLEIGGALLLLVPRAAPYAAAGLIVVMVGALVTELVQSQLGVFICLSLLYELYVSVIELSYLCINLKYARFVSLSYFVK